MYNFIINLQWDPEASVWIATSEDVPGLVLESGSYDALLERVRYTAPELLESNGVKSENVSLFFRSERCERMYA